MLFDIILILIHFPKKKRKRIYIRHLYFLHATTDLFSLPANLQNYRQTQVPAVLQTIVAINTVKFVSLTLT